MTIFLSSKFLFANNFEFDSIARKLIWDTSLLVTLFFFLAQEAWKAIDGMSKEEAKKGLVQLLTELLPEWRDWCKEHAPSNLNGEEEHESEADRLLKAFRIKLASGTSVFTSRL